MKFPSYTMANRLSARLTIRNGFEITSSDLRLNRATSSTFGRHCSVLYGLTGKSIWDNSA